MAAQDVNKLEGQIYKAGSIAVLSKLYHLLCDCKGLTEKLDPSTHAENCLYRKKVEPLELKFEEANGESN